MILAILDSCLLVFLLGFLVMVRCRVGSCGWRLVICYEAVSRRLHLYFVGYTIFKPPPSDFGNKDHSHWGMVLTTHHTRALHIQTSDHEL